MATGSLTSTSQRNSVAKNKISNLENFSLKDAREKDDCFSIQASDHDRERMSSSSMRSSAQLGTACEPRANIAVTGKYVGNEGEAKPNLTQATQDHVVERPIFIPPATDKPLLEANTFPSTKYKDYEEAKLPHPSLNKENWTSVSNSNRLFGAMFGANMRAYPEGLAEPSSEAAVEDKVGCTQVPDLENSSMVIRESRSVLSPRDGDRNLDNTDNHSKPNEFKKLSTMRLREEEQKDNISDASFVDSTTAPNISPDVVVGLIGEKQFWKARKAIVQ